MKHVDRLQLRVGLFVVLGLVSIVLAILLVGGQNVFFTRTFTVFADFSSVAGLRVGAPVYIAGINVGEVSEIRFSDKSQLPKVRVALKIAETYHARIQTDAIASIQGQGLLGDKLISIAMGSPEKPVIREGGVLLAEDQLGMAEFLEKGTHLLNGLNETVKRVNTALGDDQKPGAIHDLSAILKSLRDITGEIQKGKGLAHAMIYDKSGGELLSNLNGLSQTLKNIAEELERGHAAKNLTEVSADLKEMADNFRKIAARIEAGEGSVGGLINDPTVYYDLKTLLGKANRNKLLKAVIRSTLQKKDEQLIGKE